MDESEPEDGLTGRPKQLFNMLRGRAMKSIYLPRPAPVKFPLEERIKGLYPFAAKTIGADAPLTYLEFGVFRGKSIRGMAEYFTSPEARFIGFDSFMGLPEDWAGREAGHFSTEGAPPKIADKRVSFVKGYFQNSFSDFIAGFKYRAPVLVHFDADLYSSTLFLLTSLWHHIPEYYFIFDEFPSDEAIAMYDFTQAFPVEYEFFACTTGGKGRDTPQQLFGRMKRTALVL
jgi:hypothetical protein